MTLSKEDQAVADARKMAKAAAKKMRTLLGSMQRRLDEYGKYLDSWDEELAGGETDPRAFRAPYVGIRALEQLESITHIHTGSTDHMHYRQARDAVVNMVGGETSTW